MNENFDLFHQRLDETIIGVIATDPITEYVHCLDGSIVVCDSPEAMHNWLQAHELDPASELEFIFYEDLMASLCEDGTSYHLDAGASRRFLTVCAQDHRFHPEILHYTDDGWTMFTPVFYPYKDDLDELRIAINEFVIGYLGNDGDVTGCAEDPNSLPLAYEDCERLAISVTRLDDLATGRLASLKLWLWMLREYDV